CLGICYLHFCRLRFFRNLRANDATYVPTDMRGTAAIRRPARSASRKGGPAKWLPAKRPWGGKVFASLSPLHPLDVVATACPKMVAPRVDRKYWLLETKISRHANHGGQQRQCL
ncbi:MAG TPA: hypothetical protein VGG30_07420, partial [Pirellulales bacterium]